MIKQWRTGAVLWGLGLGSLLAQPQPPVETAYGQSPTQAVARFDLEHPVRIRVINATPHPLEYGLADPFPQVTEVQAGNQIELTQVRIPNCLAINTPMLAPVEYQVTLLPDNWIEVEVTVSPDIYGVHCLDLRLDGGIYVY